MKHFFEHKFFRLLIALFVLSSISIIGCSSNTEVDGNDNKLRGTIEIDGSSTVFPITQAVAEEFIAIHPDMRIPVGVSGTGGGFKRFATGETAISDASRPIKDKEAAAARENGISYTELTVAYDGISVIVHPDNDWVECLTVEQINQMWNPDNPAKNWNEIDPSFPNTKISLYGPGTDSGTFDYFTDVINGDEGVSRADYVASEDDNVLVMGVSGDKNSLGYLGYSYYSENKDKLKVVKVDGGDGCIEPSMDTISGGSYSPLSRPVFIYVNNDEYNSRPELAAFIEFFLTEGAQYVSEVGYVPIGDANYSLELAKMTDK
ncbi:MAG: PstS family phosphate ABC transporter substrate-binding protein [Chloroflexota bacterium]|nr:PstS family phosphate ABC transporter substrate-binding protein [Chloroflexota bacterium]